MTLIVIFSGCKKDSYYPVNDSLKPYFVFQPGSYWIYENDSTGSTDSVWVGSTSGYISDFDNTRNPTQILSVDLKGSFLEGIRIIGQPPGVSSSVTITTWVPDDSTNSNVLSYLYVFFNGWPPAVQNNQDTSHSFYIVNVEFRPSDTINNNPFRDVLYNYVKSKDSSATNSRFSTWEIRIAKNVGIIKISEKYRHYKIERSYSLLRYHIVQ